MENKKSTRFWMVTLVLTAFLIGGLAQSPAFAAEHTIKVVFLGNTEDEDYDGSMVFKDFCESRSNGAIEVQIYPEANYVVIHGSVWKHYKPGLLRSI